MDAINKQAEYLKALAHPTRLRILRLLGEGELCVCELIPRLGLDQALVSRHLAVMRSANVVKAEKRGNMVFYSLAHEKFSEIAKLLDTILADEIKEMQQSIKETGVR